MGAGPGPRPGTTSRARRPLDLDRIQKDLDRRHPGSKARDFSIPGIPGARGWTANIQGEDPVVNVLWVQVREATAVSSAA
jgi:hypothetical protein